MPPPPDVRAVLRELLRHLGASPDVAELRTTLERMLAADRLADADVRTLHHWSLPTGELQERAMRDGWHGEYLRLAAAVDALWEAHRRASPAGPDGDV